MDHDTIEGLRERHPAWRLLRAGNAPLVLAMLGRFFVDDNRGATPAGQVAEALDDLLHGINSGLDEPRYPKPAMAYLEDWAGPEAGWLRRFFVTGSDEVHFEVTPAFERAYAWVESLRARTFVGTESRLHTVVELLRQIVHGSETDPQVRLVELRRRRDAIDEEIAAVERGEVEVIDATGIRDRYQQLAGTARELLSDFREVEENFRRLDRGAREKIATWEGGKGDLLADLIGNRADITGSDQGRSFQAFYDFLLSDRRQDELTDLLAQVSALDAVPADDRLRTIHYDWAEAAERTQRTVRQISDQLRRFLDDQVWLENRRVVDLVREVEAAALVLRDTPPDAGLLVDQPGVAISLPFERPLFDARPVSDVESLLPPQPEDPIDSTALFTQVFVDQARLAGRIRTVVPQRSAALLSDIVQLYPIEQGAAEIIAYLSLQDDDLHIELDEHEETVIEFRREIADGEQSAERLLARLPKVTVRRR